jgi:hypothetical protein
MSSIGFAPEQFALRKKKHKKVLGRFSAQLFRGRSFNFQTSTSFPFESQLLTCVGSVPLLREHARPLREGEGEGERERERERKKTERRERERER